ncbi:MAG TPA: nitrogen fixation protein FixH [Gammaproteobacteria bacterium]|nr:nitrogen fixation protein FixH [Gammaproteobacteria bacterium]
MYDTVPPDPRPWYRQIWPWLLIVPPASAVLGGILTLVLAVQSPNALVVDDYYKQGLAINQHKHRIEAARRLGIEGLLRSDGRQLRLSLQGQTADTQPLMLQFVHATRSELDEQLELEPLGDGEYRARAPRLPRGIWYLRLRPPDEHWEIRARITSAGHFQARLSPDVL